jgi:hypothetical protein
MARIRTIKPEFFTSEDIVALSAQARLLYIALWCEADREGRMAWRPATFKLRYFPGDKVNIDALARELIARGLVISYGDGLAYIPKFSQHQHVNPREAASTLPVPDASARVGTRESTVPDAQGGREGKEGKGREGEVDASGAKAPPAAEALNGNAVAYIPLADGTEFGVSKDFAAELAKLYPAVDVPQTLNEIRGWGLTHPAQRKTRKGIAAHINTWMAKDQNRGA